MILVCRVGATSPNQPDIVAATNARKDLHDHVNQQLCKTCRSRPACKVLNKCESCKNWCDSQTDIPPPLTGPIPEPVVGAAPLSRNVKQRYQVITIDEGTIKDDLSNVLGISNKEDINTLGCWVITKSNDPPVIDRNQQGTVEAKNPLEDIDNNKPSTNEIIKQKEEVKDQMKAALLDKIEDVGKKFLSVDEIKKLIEDTANEVSNFIEV